MSDRLRVMLLVSHLGVGGAERQLVELANGLDKQRFELIVGTLYAGAPLDCELADNGARLVCFNRRSKFDFTTLSKLARFLRDERVHVIQPFLTPATFFGLLAGVLARTPVRIGTERAGVARRAGQLVPHPYVLAEYRLLRRADAVVPNSASGRDDLIARGIRPERIEVIYNGINPERIAMAPHDGAQVRARLGIAVDAPVVGMAARLEPMKDHETLLRAAVRVRQTIPNVRFVIVGDGSLRGRLEALASELRLGGTVIFAGADVLIAPYLAAFDVAALSSKESEGCSNYLLEAMGMAKPVVCAHIGGNPELVVDGQNGRIVAPDDADAFAEALLSVLGDPARARAMGEEGQRQFERRFALERMVRAYEELYTELWRQKAADPAVARRFATPKAALSPVERRGAR